ncbi:helix-hairpin-helix domain-containing protein [Desertivirga xinjiangensis]|uniref:helix-hairpin-helix domain-containing protein n=1 Tax=Desertivirga xinjiangensis TaxID=539206 RepID=UPI00210B9A73|nr:helix-hairpin-helix domain-containing protein [Pedobacter xinjiangensis]
MLLLIVHKANLLSAQVETDDVVEMIIESMTEAAGEDFDYTELTERLNFYRKNPIDLNGAERETLQELIFLSPLQIDQILRHRNETGKLLDLLELQTIDGLDAQTIRRLLPFVFLPGNNTPGNLSLKNLVREGRNDLFVTVSQVLQKQQGYVIPEDKTKAYYLGSRQRFLTRYRYHYGQNLSAALTMEKDAGERFISAKKIHGFDFFSGNLSYKTGGRIKKVVAGDYSLQFGQGLSLWSGLGFGKGAAVSSVAKNAVGLKAYTSTNEALFLRGLASTIQFGTIELTPFLSGRRVDGGLSESEGSGDEEVTSLVQTGLHRTSSENKKRRNTSHFLYGANILYSKRSLRIGALAYHNRFSSAFGSAKQAYDLYRFTGRSLNNFSTYYNSSWKNIYFFGELAYSAGGSVAVINGAISSLTPKVALVLVHRNYAKDYYSFFNQALAEGSSAVNEKGFYSGLVVTPGRKYEISVYADLFRFPWLRYRVDSPSWGYEMFSQIGYAPSKKFKLSIRYKFENKQENENIPNPINFLEQVAKKAYRLELNYKISEQCQLRNRAEVISYQKAEQKREYGFLLFQDVIYKPLQSRVSANIRFAVFETESYNARIYANENDVLYSFSAPAHYNRGLRYYANLRYRVCKGIDMWFRYAKTSYSDLQEIGSGLERIAGNNKSDVKLQLRFQF